MQVLEKQGLRIWLALHPQQCFAQVLRRVHSWCRTAEKVDEGAQLAGLGVSMTAFAPEVLTYPLGWIVFCLSSIWGSSWILPKQHPPLS